SLPQGARRIAVIGRGIGIAALPTLIDAAAERGGAVHGFLSARTAPNIVATDIFEEHGFRFETHVDETPNVPLVTDHLERAMRTKSFDAIYVCGSHETEHG